MQTGSHVNLTFAKYEIIERLGQGGRGEVFLARVVEVFKRSPNHPGWFRKGAKLVLKKPRIDDRRDPRASRIWARTANGGLQQEFGLLADLKGLDCVAQTVDCGVQPVEINGAPTMFVLTAQRFVDGELLDALLLREYGNRGREQGFRGIPSARDFMDLALSVTRSVKAIHARNVIHHDIWAPNIMMRSGRAILIDFGESAYRSQVSAPNEIVGKHPYMAPELRGTKCLPSPTDDIFALGGLFFYMATGEHPPLALATDRESLKHFIEDQLRARNPELLNDNPGIADLITRCLRPIQSERTPSADAVREDIEDLDRRITPGDLDGAISLLREISGSLQGETDRSIAESILRQGVRTLQDLVSGVLDITGSRSEIMSKLDKCIGSLRRGDQYLAVSVPLWFRPENVGINGRFLSIQSNLVKDGVIIRRVFVVTPAEIHDELTNAIVQSHIAKLSGLTPVEKNRWQTRFLVVSEEERAELLLQSEHCGVWIRAGSGRDITKIVPDYQVDNQLRRIRVRPVDEDESLTLNNFATRWWDAAEPLDAWPGNNSRDRVGA